MFKFFRWLCLSRSSHVPAPLERAAATYVNLVNLVKSRVIGAVVVGDELLLPTGTTTEQNYGLLTALCAYFVARTDMELERRKVSEPLRKYVWSAIPEAVLEEMEFSGTRYPLAMRTILGQSGTFRGVLETHGPDNAAILAKTLLVVAPALGATSQDTQSQEVFVADRVSVLLEKFNHYGRYLDEIATHVKRYAA